MAYAGVLAFALCAACGSARAELISARLWPAPDYTRLTIESRGELRYELAESKDPPRVVLQLAEVPFTAALAGLEAKLKADDPHVARVHVARLRPGGVRIVLDLKTEVKAQMYALKPIARYGHRLFLDLYPVVPPDPLALLIAEIEKAAGAEAGAPPAATAARRLAIVAIDPGHGGEDPGAIGRLGSREKDITLAIARRLARLVNAQPDMRAILTRDGDYFLSLAARVEKARRARADVLVSIHADAYVHTRARGSSVYALSERRASSEAARWLARRENASDLVGGVSLPLGDRHVAQTLLDLSQTATLADSLRLGEAVLQQLGRVNTLHKPTVEQASFAVLKAPDVPSILVETAFISNPQEELRLADEAYQERLARAILAGIRDWLARQPRERLPVALAAPRAQPAENSRRDGSEHDRRDDEAQVLPHHR